MASVLNETENEGLVVVGRTVGNEWAEHDTIKAVADAVDAWAEKLSLPLGLVYCGTTSNWPTDTPEYTPILIGLISFSGMGFDDEPVVGVVEPSQMSIGQSAKIPDAFWNAMRDEHGVKLSDATDVYVAAAGWTWVSLEGGGGKINVSTEDDGYRVIPEEQRSHPLEMKVGYC